MRPPRFWFNPPTRPGWQARLLAPLGWLSAMATSRRVARAPEYTPSVPVICVGNINLGGTGKTPTVIALVERLKQMGHRPHVISRGYGGALTGPLTVDERQHTAAEVGDEPLLLAAFAPVHIGRDRARAARLAETAGADVIIMDDGHQNPAIAKDLRIVVVDAGVGFGNHRCVPAGPLREPVTHGLARTDLVLSIGAAPDQTRLAADISRHAPGLPHLQATLEPLPTGMDWQGLRVLAFAGIGRPAKFFDTLENLGADLRRTVALDDHQTLSPALLGRIEADARAGGLQLVTTEKDAVRLPRSFRSRVLTLPVRLRLQNPQMLDRVLNDVMRR